MVIKARTMIIVNVIKDRIFICTSWSDMFNYACPVIPYLKKNIKVGPKRAMILILATDEHGETTD